jgi:hypothetical protein
MPAVPVLLVVPVALVVPVVWASAPMGDTAKPNAAANPRSEIILRRETVLDLTSEDICDLPLPLAKRWSEPDQRESGGGFLGLDENRGR